MENLLAAFRRRLDETSSFDAFKWFDRSYITDWIFASVAWLLAWIVKGLPPFEREFLVDDPVINHTHKSNQISGDLNWFLALLVPMAFVLAMGVWRKSSLDVHHGFLGLWAARGYNALITESLKNRVDCDPTFCRVASGKKTSKNLDKVMEGRRSFPSGHSSTIFCGMVFLSLWLAGITEAWCFSRPASPRSLFGSRIARLTLTLLPVAFATWVAVSRLEDNRHHKEDVIVGSIIGTLTAIAGYLIYWPSPFSPRATDLDREARHPRLVYRDEQPSSSRNNYDYELAATDHRAEYV